MENNKQNPAVETEVEAVLDELEKKDIKKNGKNSAYLEKANYLLEKYKSAMFFVFFQILIILLLIYGYLTTKSDTTVEVMLPKIVKDTDYGKLKIGLNESNELYYKIFGRYIVNDLYNSNESNINDKIIVLKSLIYPEKLPDYEKSIDNFAENIIQNGITVTYKETEGEVNTSNGISNYKSKGVLNIKIGKYSKKEEFCETNIEMFTKNYMLFVNSISRSCRDINSGKKSNEQ